MSSLFLAQSAGTATIVSTLVYFAVIALVFYFLLIKPQKKQQAQQMALMESMSVGDSVVTTAGFYGVIIDILDEIVIVEFGNNKNCRIPMKKSAIVEIEKAGSEN